METKTEVEVGEYKGSPTITIHELDNEGKRKQYPLISFGKKKAQAIVKYIKEIEDFSNTQK